MQAALIYLAFDLSDATDGVATLEAIASTRAEQHAAVLAEVQQVLDWAWRQFPHSHGPVDEGHDWDHDLAVHQEPGGWFAVSLTLTGSSGFVQAFQAEFGDAQA